MKMMKKNAMALASTLLAFAVGSLAVDAAHRRGGAAAAAKTRAASTLVAGLVVDNSECLHWCPDAITNGQHDPVKVCEWSTTKRWKIRSA